MAAAQKPEYTLEDALKIWIAYKKGGGGRRGTISESYANMLLYHIRSFYRPILVAGEEGYSRRAGGGIWCQNERAALTLLVAAKRTGEADRNKTIRYLKDFWNFCGSDPDGDEGDGLGMAYFAKNPARGRRFRILPEKTRHAEVTDEEAKSVVDWFRTRAQAGGYKMERLRNLALVGMLYHSGARPCEITSVRRGQITPGVLEKDVLVIEPEQTKNKEINYARYILLPPKGTQERAEFEEWLGALDAMAEKKNIPALPLFPSLRGRTKWRPMGAGNIQKNVINRYAKEDENLALRDDFGIYALRHNKATTLVRKNINLLTVQGILGHKNVATTALYTHHRAEDLAKTNAEALQIA